MDNSVVDVRVAEHRSLLAFLIEHGQVSMANDVENDFRKVLVISAASFFEKRIVDALHTFANLAEARRMGEVLKNTTFKREKYSGLFQWDGNNVNGFLRLFGLDFMKDLSKEIAADACLQEGMRAFLKLGDQRNRLIHNDFADLSSDQTVDEIYATYETGRAFIDYLCDRLRAE